MKIGKDVKNADRLDNESTYVFTLNITDEKNYPITKNFIVLTYEKGNPVPRKNNLIQFKEGKTNLDVKDDEYAVAESLPVGTKFIVTENKTDLKNEYNTYINYQGIRVDGDSYSGVIKIKEKIHTAQYVNEPVLLKIPVRKKIYR